MYCGELKKSGKEGERKNPGQTRFSLRKLPEGGVKNSGDEWTALRH